MKVAMIVAPQNFRDEELLKPKEVLESEGFSVEIFSKRAGKAKGMLGAAVEAKSYEDIKTENFEAVVFVGGAGASSFFSDKKAHEIAISAWKSGKVLAAICIAPSILANAVILKGKNVTCYPS